ncbi:MAG: hypothetical protein JWN56_2593 [Sphingobacteriales bacterium]|nr:hypothetical protein [Sphingobacteriales bacterium]
MKKPLYLLFLILLTAAKLFAQDKPVQGIVFDKDSKQRITRVYIYNTRTSKGFYNNIKGEFKTNAQHGDVLVAALQGYAVDTASVGTSNTIIFYLKRTSIYLREVTVRDTVESPNEKLAENKTAYKDAYTKGDTGDMLHLGPGGVGLSITSIYNLLSRQGRNARHLQEIIEQDYKESIIDYRYSKSLVNSATNLTAERLTDFMQQYRPSYYFILEANDYQLISFIKSSYQKYMQNPKAHRLPPLKP